MRFAALTAVGAFVAALALASPAGALTSLSLNPIGGGQYLIQLTVGEEGLAAIQWDVTSDSGAPDTSNSLAMGFSVPGNDPACKVLFGCTLTAIGPFANPANPTGLNGYALFATDPDEYLMGAPVDQPFTVGLLTFSNAGSEGNVSIPFSSIVCVDGSGNPGPGSGSTTSFSCGPVPEPATPTLLGLALLGLVVVARGRSSRAS